MKIATYAVVLGFGDPPAWQQHDLSFGFGKFNHLQADNTVLSGIRGGLLPGFLRLAPS